MVTFKLKNFAIMEGLMIGSSLLGLAQGKKQMAQNEALQEQQLREQRKLQERQIQAQATQNKQMISALKKVANQNPEVAGAAAGQQLGILQQQQFALPANFAKNAVGFVEDMARVGKNAGWHKKIASGLATGAMMGGTALVADKVIQKDAKKNGIDLGESDNEGRKKSAKGLAKGAAVIGTSALAVLGAKRGAFGKTVQTSANKYLTRDTARKIGNTLKNAARESVLVDKVDKAGNVVRYTNGKPMRNLNKTNIGLSLAFGAAMPVMSYKKQKDAIEEQTRETEKTFAVANVSRFAGARQGIRNFMKTPGQHVIGGLNWLFGGGGRKESAKFVEAVSKQGAASGNPYTQKAGEFLGKHKKTALVATGGLGYATVFKPWSVGEEAVKNAAGVIDKDSMKYDRSQQKTVE